MNKNVKILIIDNTDLNKSVEGKNVSDIDQTDLRPKSFKEFQACDIVICNLNGQTLIMKNRFGISGIIMSPELASNENHKSGNTAKKKSLLARIFGSK
jgi:hypothetical protein